MKRTIIKKLVQNISLISMSVILLAHQDTFATERNKHLFYSNIDGVPRNITSCIEQDNYGYLWVGTANGVARYDGHVFHSYDQLSGYRVNELAITLDNNLWLANDEGLYFYNRINDQFEMKYEGEIRGVSTYGDDLYFASGTKIWKLHTDEIVEIITDTYIHDYCITKNGIWYSNDFDGIKYKPYNTDIGKDSNILDGKLIRVIREIDGLLFLGCNSGQLFVLNEEKKIIEVNIDNHHSFMEITKIDNEYWLATDGNGILILDENLNYTRSISKDLSQKSNLKSNSITDIYLGQHNEVWIATHSAGIACMMVDNSPFLNITPVAGKKNTLVAEEGVTAFTKGDKIFFGTNYGLSILNEDNGLFTNFSKQQLEEDIHGAKVVAINSDNNNNYWIGTYDGLLGKYSPNFKFLRSYQPCGGEINSMQRIIFINKYKEENLIIATQVTDKNLLNFNLKNETFTPFTLNTEGINKTNFQITSLRKNKKNELLALSTQHGLCNVNIEKNILEDNFPEINKYASSRLVDFYHDKDGFYWLATQKDGLIRISEDGLEFNKWTTEQGLPTNSLLRLESIDDKFLWISTINGLCRFEMETGTILIYKHEHGLPANEFGSRSSTKTNDGRLIFGSIAGFTIVDQSKVHREDSETEVIISDITFQNRSIKSFTDKQLLEIPLEETKKIVLPYKKNSFTIHFFSKDKDLPKFNNFAFRLLGFEDNWIYLGETKQTTYTNLSPGIYTFEVKSTNNSNVWSDTPTQLIIEIIPPWYFTGYAYTAYILLLVAIFLGLLYAYAYRLRLKKEVEMSEYKVRKEHELTENKLAFFTSISHDLMTPLTLIDTPVNDLLNSPIIDNEGRRKLLIVQRNSKRLYTLIKDLLDFRKLTQKQLPLEVSEAQIDIIIENIHKSFIAECDKKSITLERLVSVKHPVFVDVNKIEKIIWNLLSNAIKFTKEDGKIVLSAEDKTIDDKTFLKLSIKDSGIGISNKELDKIFNRFYQNKENNLPHSVGTGIGLSIVKDLVELHHGVIEVESKLGTGSIFTITIPVDKSEYLNNELAAATTELAVELTPNIEIDEVAVEKPQNSNYNRPILLLVEDNVELREYMAGYFEENFKVYQAGDGREGLDQLNQKNPDIIITDIMMPNMDGYEFCKEVRSNFNTSHLPIIMLTANSIVEQQIEGITIGADAYVTKPFDIKLLKTIVNATLENRKKIRNRILNVGKINDSENVLSQKDIAFVDDLKSCIETNLSNQKLNVEFLSKHFAIGRTQLNLKIKSLTGQTPNNLIRSIRLKKAYEIIKTDGVRVSEAAYRTGFTDPNYFTLCFKKEFGENPSKIS